MLLRYRVARDNGATKAPPETTFRVRLAFWCLACKVYTRWWTCADLFHHPWYLLAHSRPMLVVRADQGGSKCLPNGWSRFCFDVCLSTTNIPGTLVFWQRMVWVTELSSIHTPFPALQTLDGLSTCTGAQYITLSFVPSDSWFARKDIQDCGWSPENGDEERAESALRPFR